MSQGYYGGELACAGNCQDLILDDCVATASAGRRHQSGYSEECDGVEFGGRTCQTEGYYTGTLFCTTCRLGTGLLGQVRRRPSTTRR
jgi:hypothetical protein